MQNKSVITTGGLILQSIELRKILNEKDCIGLAFGLKQAGVAPNVDLSVYKVSHDGREFIGVEYPIESKKGAAGVDRQLGSIYQYRFEYFDHLEKCRFDFAFLEADDFQTVWRNGEEEVFLTGALKDYGHTGSIKGEWFTLAISPRSEVIPEAPGTPRRFSLPPQMKHLDSCPPEWVSQPEAYSTTGKGKTIRFAGK